MPVTPGSLGRRYAPFLAIAVVQVLLVAIVPSRVARQSSNVATLGPNGAGNGAVGDGGATASGTSGSGADGSSAALGADGGTGEPSGGTGGGGSTGAGSANASGSASGSGLNSGDRSRCDPNGFQIGPTYYMPRCAPVWHGGDNRGNTMTGVYGDHIDYVFYAAKADPQVSAILATQGLAASTHDQCAAWDAFNKEINKRWEFYGRVARPIDGSGDHKGSTQNGCDAHFPHYQGQCSLTPPDPPCERAEAAQIAAMKPAYVIAPVSDPAFTNELAKRHIMVAGGQWEPTVYHTGVAPYYWDVFLDGTRSAHLTAEYYCKKLAGKRVKFAGPDVMTMDGPTKPPPIRKLGVAYPATNGDPTFKISVDEFIKDVTGRVCGSSSDAPVVRPYESDITTAQQQSQTAVSALKNAHVTTAVCFCDPIAPVFFTNAMDQQNYHPEHLLSGTGLLDYDLLGRLYSPSQWQHAFGVSQLYQFPPFDQTDASKAWKDAGNPGVPDGTENLPWSYFSLMAGSFQSAGPDITPENMHKGLFAGAPRGGWAETHDASKPLLKFGATPDDYTALEDAREVWWSATAKSSVDGKSGAYVAVDGGRRYTFGQWPSGDPQVFK